MSRLFINVCKNKRCIVQVKIKKQAPKDPALLSNSIFLLILSQSNFYTFCKCSNSFNGNAIIIIFIDFDN